jgi:hypothetical protein
MVIKAVFISIFYILKCLKYKKDAKMSVFFSLYNNCEKQLKTKNMRSFIKTLLLYIVSIYVTLFGYVKVIDSVYLTEHLQLQKDEIIKELDGKDSEKFFLKAGNEKFGFSHILQRHSRDYYSDSSHKGILFPKGTKGNQIIQGIETVLSKGEKDPSAYGNKTVLKYKLKLNGEEAFYRLVMNDNNEVITFYKLKQS